MNPYVKHESTLDLVLSLVLRIGLSLAFLTVLTGGSLFLWQHASETIDYKIFNGEPASLKGIESIFEAAARDQYLAIIQLGILLLIATPVMRVFSCAVVFAKERDFLYTALSTLVLAILLFSFL